VTAITPRPAPSGGWSVVWAITLVTLRALLARRRAVLMLLLAAIPVLLALLARLRGLDGNGARQVTATLGPVIVATLLPLISLVFGTSAIGAELEDGSAIHLLTKPVPRWRIVMAKVLAAAPVAAGLTVASTLVTGLLIGAGRGGINVTVAFAVGVAIGALIYVVVFIALSVLSSRALIVGLVYVAIWEGALAGLFEGTRALSIRQYVSAFIGAVNPAATVSNGTALPLSSAIVGAAVVVTVAFVVAVRRLESHQVRTGD
jgi:ABC-2 type transport system permease protein